jgi:hypothetical protein
MVKRFPHLLACTILTTGNSYRDENTGQWITPVGTSVEVSEDCRLRVYESPTRQTKDENTDFKQSQYIVYTSLLLPDLKEGQEVTITEKATGNVLCTGKVARSHRNQFHYKLWL